MYNFSGLLFRLWGVCGILLLLGVVCIILTKPWVNKFKIKKCILGILIIAFSIGLGAVYIFRIVSPDVSSYTGQFIETSRNNREAPPLPVTNKYVFWNGEGKKQPFYLDLFSKEDIYPYDFEEGKEYTIYYDTFTWIIVKVEAGN